MKLSAKPISSPGRTEKFPPPLMRFLRTNIGSKSLRAPTRSRSSPMFPRKKTTSSNAIETAQQEPSSPKVTCMGQVRVRKKSKKKKKKTKSKSETVSSSSKCHQWIPRVLFCRETTIQAKKMIASLPILRKCGSFFQLGFRRKEESSVVTEQNHKIESKLEEEEEDTDDSDEEEEESKSRAFSTESYPAIPTNALILTRCRSAPYRSSSLASRFWESPINNNNKSEEEEEEEEEEENRSEEERVVEKEESSEAPEKAEEEEEREELGLGLGLGIAILSRCKSEPARIGERLYPEIGYWNSYRGRRRTRRFGFVHSCD